MPLTFVEEEADYAFIREEEILFASANKVTRDDPEPRATIKMRGLPDELGFNFDSVEERRTFFERLGMPLPESEPRRSTRR